MAATNGVSISVIVPFHNAAAHLQCCLESIVNSDYSDYELLLVDDGSTDSSSSIARRYAATLITLPNALGPAAARNRGAERARGDILYFTDSDVICYPDTLSKIARTFSDDSELEAVIGSYDDDPPATNFFSRYKNLTHHFVHQQASASASTFWTGCGAVRRQVFCELRGFSESYRRPSIEDIEFGYRLRADGRRILLRKDLMVKHAKVWSFRSMLRSDILDRALPWARLQFSCGKVLNDLNLRSSQRAAALLACTALLALAAAWWRPWLCIVVAAGAMLALIVLNRRLYHFYHTKGGPWFALRSIVVHWFYYIYSVASFAMAFVQHHMAHRRSRAIRPAAH